ncbi:MAG: TolC family protein [Anaerotignum sp.]|nr:TolC family protein [Anaerotignum sp.]MBQ7085359.1 TolC family protein [Anaerotignum sp.]
MKGFLYKAKGVLALALAMSMFCPQVFAAEAISSKNQDAKTVIEGTSELTIGNTEEINVLPQLTFEEALRRVKKHSPDLKDLEATMDMLWDQEEKLEDAGITSVPSYDYKHWVPDAWYLATAGLFKVETGQKQTTIGTQLTELGLEVGLKSMFVNIIANEKGLELAKEAAEMQKTLYLQGYTKYRLGMLSKYNLEQLQITYEKAKNSLEAQEYTLEQLYVKLNDMMGVSVEQRYELVYDVTFVPYEMGLTMDQYINAAMKDDLSIALMELEVETAKFNRNYVPYSDGGTQTAQLKLTHEQKQRALRTAKAKKEVLIRNTYLQIKDLETDYTSAQADLTKALADYRAAQINYQAGNLTKVAVDGAEMAVKQAELALQGVAYQHDMYVFMFENPSLLADTDSAAAQ